MVLRGRIIADCVVAHGADQRPPGRHVRAVDRRPGRRRTSRGSGATPTSTRFQFGDRVRHRPRRPGRRRRSAAPATSSSARRRASAARRPRPAGDAGHDPSHRRRRGRLHRLLPAVDERRRAARPARDRRRRRPHADARRPGRHRLLPIYTTGSHGADRNYVINVLDTGARERRRRRAGDLRPRQPRPALQRLRARARSTRNADRRHLPAARVEVHRHRGARTASTRDGVPTTATSPTETADRPGVRRAAARRQRPTAASAATAAAPSATRPSDLRPADQLRHRAQRPAERLGHGGNDEFFVDDNSAITTLDGGAGYDKFQIGQIFGTKRDDVDEGALLPHDTFPVLIATTRGWLSPGIHAPLVATGGTGNDEFTVYSNQAELRLEGDDDNDLFIVRAFALAAVCDTDADGDGDCDSPTSTSPPTPTPALPGRLDNDGVCDAADERGVDGHRRGLDNAVNGQQRRRRLQQRRRHRPTRDFTTADPTQWEDDVIPLDADGVARADHRARLLDRPAARHPRRRRRGRGLVQRQRSGLGRRRHRLRQAGRARHRVRRRHRHHRQADLRRRPQRPLHERSRSSRSTASRATTSSSSSRRRSASPTA